MSIEMMMLSVGIAIGACAGTALFFAADHFAREMDHQACIRMTGANSCQQVWIADPSIVAQQEKTHE